MGNSLENPLLGPIPDVPSLTPEESTSLQLFGINSGSTDEDTSSPYAGYDFPNATGVGIGGGSSDPETGGLNLADPFSPQTQENVPGTTLPTVSNPAGTGGGLSIPGLSNPFAPGGLLDPQQLNPFKGASGLIPLAEEIALRASLVIAGLVLLAIGFVLAGGGKPSTIINVGGGGRRSSGSSGGGSSGGGGRRRSSGAHFAGGLARGGEEAAETVGEVF